MRPDAKVKPPDEVLVEGILKPQGAHWRVNTDASSIAISAARLPSRACRVPQDCLAAVQIRPIVKE